MSDAGAVVPPIGVQQCTRGAKEEQVVLGARIGEPEVPRPGVRQFEHGQPFTPAAAMLLTKDRWNATKSAITGTVIIDA